MIGKSTSLNPVFSYSSILDLDLSIFKMVYSLYDTKKYIRDDIFRDDYSLKCLFLEMWDKNPLQYLIKEEFKDDYDNLYEEFRNDPKIVDYYKFYATGRMVYMLEEMTYANTTIICNNKQEANFLKDTFTNTKIITNSQFNINGKYDAFYTGNINELGTFIENPSGLQIQLLRFKYNLEKKRGIEMPRLKVALPYMDTNKFSIVDPYTDVIVPFE